MCAFVEENDVLIRVSFNGFGVERERERERERENDRRRRKSRRNET